MEKQRFTIKLSTEELSKDNLARSFFVGSLVVVIVMTLIIGGMWKLLPREVPLYYSLPWGEARLVPRLQLFILPSVGLMMVIANVIVAKIFRNYPVLLTRMLSVSAVMVVCLLLLSEIGIIQSIL